MGTPAVRSVVLVTFPFSDLSASKLRPAVVLADVGRGDYILCQVTSNPYADPMRSASAIRTSRRARYTISATPVRASSLRQTLRS